MVKCMKCRAFATLQCNQQQQQQHQQRSINRTDTTERQGAWWCWWEDTHIRVPWRFMAITNTQYINGRRNFNGNYLHHGDYFSLSLSLVWLFWKIATRRGQLLHNLTPCYRKCILLNHVERIFWKRCIEPPKVKYVRTSCEVHCGTPILIRLFFSHRLQIERGIFYTFFVHEHFWLVRGTFLGIRTPRTHLLIVCIDSQPNWWW